MDSAVFSLFFLSSAGTKETQQKSLVWYVPSQYVKEKGRKDMTFVLKGEELDAAKAREEEEKRDVYSVRKDVSVLEHSG